MTIKIVIMVMLFSLIVSAVITYMMMNVFLKKLKKVDDEYRHKLVDVVVDTVEKKIKGAR